MLIKKNGSQIIICNDFEQIIKNLKENINPEYLRIFQKDDFLLGDVRECIKEAYISSEQLKTIVLCANKYPDVSQNALLTILEESPKNINFILLVKSKSILLPTIKSRLSIIDKRIKAIYTCDIDIFNLNDEIILDLIDKYSKQSKTSIKEMMYALWQQLMKNDIKINNQDIFYTSIRLLELNTKPVSVLSNFFLSLRNITKK